MPIHSMVNVRSGRNLPQVCGPAASSIGSAGRKSWYAADPSGGARIVLAAYRIDRLSCRLFAIVGRLAFSGLCLGLSPRTCAYAAHTVNQSSSGSLCALCRIAGPPLCSAGPSRRQSRRPCNLRRLPPRPRELEQPPRAPRRSPPCQLRAPRRRTLLNMFTFMFWLHRAHSLTLSASVVAHECRCLAAHIRTRQASQMAQRVSASAAPEVRLRARFAALDLCLAWSTHSHLWAHP